MIMTFSLFPRTCPSLQRSFQICWPVLTTFVLPVTRPAAQEAPSPTIPSGDRTQLPSK